MKKKSLISLIICLCMVFSLVLTSCGDKTETKPKATEKAAETTTANDIDYMVLVNKTHKLPDDWEKKLTTVSFTNTVGDRVEVEKKAYDAYLKLKEELKKIKVDVDLDSARRSVAEQQRIMDDFTKKYGADYAAKTVAKPGYSEHHTGLALDLYLIIDGKDVTENEDMEKYPKIWAKIHKLLPKYGFILRYLKDKEHITGYGYEPWHIRYINSPETAKEITAKGITLEGYLNTASEKPVKIDLGKSDIYSEKELNDAVIQIKCQYAFWQGCELENIRYAGDKAVNKENLRRVNSNDDNKMYKKIAEFFMDFRTLDEVKGTTLEPNHSYKDYQWWLGVNEDGGWDIVDQGYD